MRAESTLVSNSHREEWAERKRNGGRYGLWAKLWGSRSVVRMQSCWKKHQRGGENHRERIRFRWQRGGNQQTAASFEAASHLIAGQLSGPGVWGGQLWLVRLKVLNVIPKGTLKTWPTHISPSTHKVLGLLGSDSEAKLDQARTDSLE